MKITRLEVGEMKANCFLFSDENGKTAIVDPGDDAEYIISTIQRENLTPELIILTHGHVDHVMAALEMKLAFNIPIYMHKADVFLLKNMRKSADYYLNFDPGPPPDVDIYIKNNSRIKFGNLELEVVETPGHTPGSVCLLNHKHKKMFVGDLMFEGGYVGRTDFSYSNESDLMRSIQHIKKLGQDWEAFSGHGETFTL